MSENEAAFEACLRKHILTHPLASPRDIVKFCYQASFGAEHLLKDIEKAREYFFGEYAKTPPADIPLSEKLCESFSRVNIAAWKMRALPPETLFSVFVQSARCRSACGGMAEHLACARKIISESENVFSLSEWDAFTAEYLKGGAGPLHHSEEYRALYFPAYRVVRNELLKKAGLSEESA